MILKLLNILYNNIMTELNKNESYVKADNNIVINQKAIRWIKKIEECMEICAKQTGCDIVNNFDTISICKKNNPDSYYKLNKHFE